MKKWLLLVCPLLLLFLLVVSGCSTLSNIIGSTVPSVQTLTPAAGSFSSGTTAPYCTLTVQPGSVSAPTEVTLSAAGNFPPSQVAPGTDLTSFSISAVGVSTLLQPATVTIDYGASSVTGLPTANIQIWELLNGQSTWTLLNGSPNLSAYSDSVTVSTLGTFAIVAD